METGVKKPSIFAKFIEDIKRIWRAIISVLISSNQQADEVVKADKAGEEIAQRLAAENGIGAVRAQVVEEARKFGRNNNSFLVTGGKNSKLNPAGTVAGKSTTEGKVTEPVGGDERL